MTAYDNYIFIDGDQVFFGFDGSRKVLLFGGSMEITHPATMTIEDVKADLIANYQEYKQDDLMATYRAYGFYD